MIEQQLQLALADKLSSAAFRARVVRPDILRVERLDLAFVHPSA